MSLIPNISASVLANAKAVWDETIDKFGSDVLLSTADGTESATVKAFARRPKILGLFDRTQASFDQERYMLMIKAGDVPGGASPEKFMFARWDDEDHAFISVTKVELVGTVFGYRILVKG